MVNGSGAIDLFWEEDPLPTPNIWRDVPPQRRLAPLRESLAYDRTDGRPAGRDNDDLLRFGGHVQPRNTRPR